MVNPKAPVRCFLSLAVAGAVASIPLGGCTIPKDDYDNYLNNTADARGQVYVPDSGPVDASLPTASFQADYFASCLSVLAQGNPKQALNFIAHANFTLGTPPTSGTLDLTLTALKNNATDLSQTAPGTPISKTGAPVNSDATFIADLGPASVDGSANPITPGTAIAFSDVAFHGVLLGQQHFCAQIHAHVTSPLALNLEPPGNYCIFDQVQATTGPINCEGNGPVCAASIYVCPGAPAADSGVP